MSKSRQWYEDSCLSLGPTLASKSCRHNLCLPHYEDGRAEQESRSWTARIHQRDVNKLQQKLRCFFWRGRRKLCKLAAFWNRHRKCSKNKSARNVELMRRGEAGERKCGKYVQQSGQPWRMNNVRAASIKYQSNIEGEIAVQSYYSKLSSQRIIKCTQEI